MLAHSSGTASATRRSSRWFCLGTWMRACSWRIWNSTSHRFQYQGRSWYIHLFLWSIFPSFLVIGVSLMSEGVHLICRVLWVCAVGHLRGTRCVMPRRGRSIHCSFSKICSCLSCGELCFLQKILRCVISLSTSFCQCAEAHHLRMILCEFCIKMLQHVVGGWFCERLGRGRCSTFSWINVWFS